MAAPGQFPPPAPGAVQPPVADAPERAVQDDATEREVQDIEALLRERIRLDELLQQTFRRSITLLFTDIEGSTAYYEQRGDLSGRQMVQRHNDLLMPIIAQHQGTLLKTIGDALMVSFSEASAAVQAAIAMQRTLRDGNSGRAMAEQIHIRIGINSGQGLVERQDVFGDVVNVAARVEATARPDQILISRATYEQLPVSIPCWPRGATPIKGKALPIELYEVHWDERQTAQETVLLRGETTQQPEKVLVLEISRDAARLKLSAHERWPDEETAVKHYEYLAVAFAVLQQEVEALVALLSRVAPRQGSLAAATWQDIQARAHSLYNQLLTPSIQEQLRASSATDLLLYIDEALVQIPWELLFDGQTFLCRRFSMGRIVSTQQAPVEGQERQPGQALSMLIVADPRGDLEAAAREGSTIRDELAAEAQRLRIDVRSSSVDIASIQDRLAQYDVLHYAGHADYDLQDSGQSGWLLADGKLTARDILQMRAIAPLPALVFCNACRSGQTAAWHISQTVEQEIYGLANAFLLAGAQHYIGTVWEMPDQPSCAFAIDFYRALAQGIGVGEALRRARQTLAERYGAESVVWAGYVLYGDPTVRYLPGTQDTPLVREAGAPQPTPPRRQDKRPLRRHWKRPVVLGAGALVALVLALAVLFWGRTAPPGASALTLAYQALEQRDWPQAQTLFQQLGASQGKPAQSQGYAGLAALALARQEYPQALSLAEQAESVDPEIAYSHVIRGHVLAHQGKLPEALAEYQLATEKSHSVPWQQALAHNRLGWLYAAQGDTPRALEQYDRALSRSQDIAVVYTNKAHLLAQLGKPQEAMALYRQALRVAPDDPLATTLLRQAERRQQLALDKEKQAHLDQLVAELLHAHQAGRKPASPADAWTSTPLTLAVLEPQHKGSLAPRAGEEEALWLSMAQALRASGRVNLVERDILDKLLAELKLSASELVDPKVAVRIGQILAARLIATGSFIRAGDAAQFNVRLVETETTRIRASGTTAIEPPGAFDSVVEPLTRALLTQVRQAYPLQGRIVRLTPQAIILDIGADQGVTPGLTMQVFGSEEPLRRDGQVVGYHHTPVGLIEVSRVEAQLAQARVLEQSAAFQEGWKVREREGE